MLKRRWDTAFRLLKHRQFKEFSTRTLRFLSTFDNEEELITYPEWRKKWISLDNKERFNIKKCIDSFEDPPAFTILLDAKNYISNLIAETINSVIAQLYPNWVLWISNFEFLEEEQQKKILNIQDDRIHLTNVNQPDPNEWVIELITDVELNEKALFINAFSIINNPSIKIVYSDHDHISPSGEFCDPYMKPSWNPDLFAAMNYCDPLIAYKGDLWEGHTLNESGRHDFLLKATKMVPHEQIFHISNVLSSVRVTEDGNHLEPTCKRVIQSLPEPEPKVSILIPSKDNGRMLEKCLVSLFKKTFYSNFEVILVNHETTENKALRTIERFNAKENFTVLNFSGSFNFSAMMNLAGNSAVGEILVLLNNDIEIIESEWLNELVSQVSRPEVGIVGALLVFGDGSIQHAGVHPGLGGLMGHGHKHLPENASGYFNRLKAVHEVAAVTGACLAINKSDWEYLGGLDEEELPVAYNDIDLCLRARKEGLRVILTPYAKLVHHESVSRGLDEPPERNPRLAKELRVMEKRWDDFLYEDPAYSDNLDQSDGGFKLSKSPKIYNFSN